MTIDPRWAPPTVPPRKSGFSGLAVFAFILALVGIISFLPAVIAVILGAVAMRQTRTGGKRGRGLAIWSVVIGVGAVVVWSIFLTLSVIQQNRYADLNREMCTSVARETFIAARDRDPMFCAGYSVPSN